MTSNDYYSYAEKFLDRCLELTSKKGHDYAKDDTDHFSAIKATKLIGVNPLTGLLTRMMDKMSRLGSFNKRGILKVEDESIHDTLLDLAVYACLTSAYITSLKQEEKRNRTTPKE